MMKVSSVSNCYCSLFSGDTTVREDISAKFNKIVVRKAPGLNPAQKSLQFYSSAVSCHEAGENSDPARMEAWIFSLMQHLKPGSQAVSPSTK